MQRRVISTCLEFMSDVEVLVAFRANGSIVDHSECEHRAKYFNSEMYDSAGRRYSTNRGVGTGAFDNPALMVCAPLSSIITGSALVGIALQMYMQCVEDRSFSRDFCVQVN